MLTEGAGALADKTQWFQTCLRGRTVTFENKSMQRGQPSVFSVHAYYQTNTTSLQSNLAVVRLLYLSVSMR